MSRRYSGSVISATKLAPSIASASGVWSLSSQIQAITSSSWPVPRTYLNYITPGTYTFTVPGGVTLISAMAVGGGGAGDDGKSGDGGGGGGGGGAACYFSNLTVTPGQTMTVVVGAGGPATSIKGSKAPDGTASSITFGSFVMTATGGIGGSPYSTNPGASPSSPSFSNTPIGTTTGGFAGGGGGAGYNGGGGGGGAGGLGGVGGNGSASRVASGQYNSTTPATNGGGGGGGGADVLFSNGTTNNGYTSGSGGAGQYDTTGGGGGGSATYSASVPSTAGGVGNGSTSAPSQGGAGGFPGGGGGGSFDNGTGLASAGGGGFVRIVWGTNDNGTRQFPTNAGDT